ncbi:MAG: hypothetical protein K0Q46_5359 [Rhodococcus erythropolis]|jgi:hypothetical protein|nr:hypothetical protein [Rhodococcus erythropolis]
MNLANSIHLIGVNPLWYEIGRPDLGWVWRVAELSTSVRRPRGVVACSVHFVGNVSVRRVDQTQRNVLLWRCRIE